MSDQTVNVRITRGHGWTRFDYLTDEGEVRSSFTDYGETSDPSRIPDDRDPEDNTFTLGLEQRP